MEKSTAELGDLSKKSDPENETITLLAVENTQTVSQNTQNKSRSSVLHDNSIENTLENRSEGNNFFQTNDTTENDITWNGLEIEKLDGSRVEIRGMNNI